jgi:hypothetical protein
LRRACPRGLGQAFAEEKEEEEVKNKGGGFWRCRESMGKQDKDRDTGGGTDMLEAYILGDEGGTRTRTGTSHPE